MSTRLPHVVVLGSLGLALILGCSSSSDTAPAGSSGTSGQPASWRHHAPRRDHGRDGERRARSRACPARPPRRSLSRPSRPGRRELGDRRDHLQRRRWNHHADGHLRCGDRQLHGLGRRLLAHRQPQERRRDGQLHRPQGRRAVHGERDERRRRHHLLRHVHGEGRHGQLERRLHGGRRVQRLVLFDDEDGRRNPERYAHRHDAHAQRHQGRHTGDRHARRHFGDRNVRDRRHVQLHGQRRRPARSSSPRGGGSLLSARRASRAG